jgi:hypothetical protein
MRRSLCAILALTLPLVACGGGASTRSTMRAHLAPLARTPRLHGAGAMALPEAAGPPPPPPLASAGHAIAAACRRFGRPPWLGGDRVAEEAGLEQELPKLRDLRAAFATPRFPRGGRRVTRRERRELRRAVAAYVRLVEDAIVLDRRLARDLGHELPTAMAAHAATASRRLSIAASIAAATAETCLERLSPE